MANYIHILYTAQVEAEYTVTEPEGLVVLRQDRDLSAPAILTAPRIELREDRLQNPICLVAPRGTVRDRWSGVPVKLITRRPG